MCISPSERHQIKTCRSALADSLFICAYDSVVARGAKAVGVSQMRITRPRLLSRLLGSAYVPRADVFSLATVGPWERALESSRSGVFVVRTTPRLILTGACNRAHQAGFYETITFKFSQIPHPCLKPLISLELDGEIVYDKETDM
uniref:Uncharacterized protein n=1 Tax=Knipowitschia caucasica TaxID=637954 RepID=A0AAV2MDC6_KNICA